MPKYREFYTTTRFNCAFIMCNFGGKGKRCRNPCDNCYSFYSLLDCKVFSIATSYDIRILGYSCTYSYWIILILFLPGHIMQQVAARLCNTSARHQTSLLKLSCCFSPPMGILRARNPKFKLGQTGEVKKLKPPPPPPPPVFYILPWFPSINNNALDTYSP